MTLHATDFREFHEEVHGYPPFPWQQRILDEVLENRWFPDLVDVPTGTGKTTLMDIAVFALAVDASDHATARWMPRRIFLVVDRRIIVDQAGNRALKLSRLLEQAHESRNGPTALRRVAEALSSLTGGGTPLSPAVLRGGTIRDDNWARRPDQPVLGASTVDQVGSRLLFSGYGVGSRSASIHAGLLGRDTLFLLDEVHLSQPFRETLAQLRRYGGDKWCEEQVAPPTQSVELSATPGEETDGTSRSVFRLQSSDLEHPLIQKRLSARKPAELVQTSSGTQKAFTKAALKASLQMVRNGHRTVGVVANRVASSRAICRELKALSEKMGFEVFLVTGRMRALDRQDLLDEIGPRIRAGRSRSQDDVPLIIVATQCIEAGADLDFDALVTECASLDALKQRFGRLDRLGEYGQAESVIVARKTDVSASGGDDPIYGDALKATWEWLEEMSSNLPEGEALDFGVHALGTLDPPPGLSAPAPSAPILLPAHLDAWSQTGPAPLVQPDASLWLHGPEERAKDVQVVWRADLREEELRTAAGSGETGRADRALLEILDRLALTPPASPEALAVPVSAARAWLTSDGPSEAEVFDVEGARDDADSENAGLRPALAWMGDRSQVISSARDLRPGTTLVVPTTYGGLSLGSWDAGAKNTVTDLGDRSQLVARGRVALRLHPSLFMLEGAEGIPMPSAGEPQPHEDTVGELLEWLDGLSAAPWLGMIRRELHRAGSRDVIVRRLNSQGGSGTSWWGIALKGRRPLALLRRLREEEVSRGPAAISTRRAEAESGLEHFIEDFGTEEHSSFLAQGIELDQHLTAVARTARDFAHQLGLSQELQEALWWAGRLHDLGKADRRFQMWLHGGDEIELAASGRHLAKSPLHFHDAPSRRVARQRAGYPRGIRHEMTSTAMVTANPNFLSRLDDPDLVLHLISSHHGWGRPFAPPVLDPDPVTVSFAPEIGENLTFSCSSEETLAAADSGVAERFWRLNRRYGWHGLAFLESILRLADHRVSEAEENA